MAGPSWEELSWRAPFDEYVARAELWGAEGLGMSVFVASVLSFTSHLGPLPSSFLDVEAEVCQIFFPGPSQLMSASLTESLKVLSFRKDLLDIRW